MPITDCTGALHNGFSVYKWGQTKDVVFVFCKLNVETDNVFALSVSSLIVINLGETDVQPVLLLTRSHRSHHRQQQRGTCATLLLSVMSVLYNFMEPQSRREWRQHGRIHSVLGRLYSMCSYTLCASRSFITGKEQLSLLQPMCLLTRVRMSHITF